MSTIYAHLRTCMTSVVTLANVQEFFPDLQFGVFIFDQIRQCRNFQSSLLLPIKVEQTFKSHLSSDK